MTRLSTALFSAALGVLSAAQTAHAAEQQTLPREKFVEMVQGVFARSCEKHRETVRTSSDHVVVAQSRIGVSASCECMPKAITRWADDPDAPASVPTDDMKALVEPIALACAARAARSVFVEECRHPSYQPPAGVHDMQRYCRCVTVALDGYPDEELGQELRAKARADRQREDADKDGLALPKKQDDGIAKAEASCAAEQRAR